MISRRNALTLLLASPLAGLSVGQAQPPANPPAGDGTLMDRGFIGNAVSRDVQQMYKKGLSFLQATQDARGTWPAGEGAGAGTTGLSLLACLASGADPNFGPYRQVIRKGLRHIIDVQSLVTGYIGPSMYHHGFALLALCEAMGSVDDTLVFDADDPQEKRSLAQAVELAVRAALTAQKRNRHRAWRYSPGANDADTSVSGAVMMGLLAARNAGIEVPDQNIDQALQYFVSMTAEDGTVGYVESGASGGESIARSSITHLVLALAKRSDLPAYQATLDYLVANLETKPSWPEYARYYQAQALFQSAPEQWRQWNRKLIAQSLQLQRPDGSFPGEVGITNSTSMSLLALALNFRFLPIYER